MIKLAESYLDIHAAIDLLEHFLIESAYSDTVKIDRRYLGRICGLAQTTGGAVWLGYVDKKPVGLLIAFLEPNMWNMNQMHMREVVWYVLPEHRSSSIGGRLFKTYQKHCEELLTQGKIAAYFTTQMSSTDPIDLERRGFKLIERTFIKETV